MAERGRRGRDGEGPIARAKAGGDAGRRTLTQGLSRRSGADVVEDAVAGKDAGQPVARELRAKVEPHVGASLEGVRVHEDEAAREAAGAIGARAFTYQSDVFLGPGESSSDVALMAHELAHV